MRSFLKCGLAALFLAATPAWADEVAEAPASSPRFRVIEANVHIPATRSVNGYELVDENTILLKTGANRWYAAEISGSCGRSARFHTAIGVDSNGGGRIDEHSEIVVDGRHCPIDSISRVELIPEDQAATPATPEG